jgi:hypothetical protein
MATGKRGRPRKEIERTKFEKLCAMMCTLDEIAGVFQCSIDTIENWSKRTYGVIFSDIYKKLSASGKMSLRRAQFRMAEKNPTMAIWLGKQYLGQTDRVDVRIEDVDAAIERELARVATGSQVEDAQSTAEQTVH